MIKRLSLALVLSIVLALLAFPVLAAPTGQGSGGIHFGPYTLAAGDSVSGDLTVFGGPVTLKENSNFGGDLTVFGAVVVKEGAVIDGTLVVMGTADIAGEVDGDVFSGGAVSLAETAHIMGDVSAVGTVDQKEGAVIEGEIIPVDESEFNWRFPINIPAPVWPRVTTQRTPFWLQGLWSLFRGMVNVVVLSLLALVIISLWPQQTERVGRVIEEAPLTAFGMGLLVLLLTPLAFVVLAITICLLPFGVVGLIIVGVGVLLGWVAMGLVLGRRILVSMFNRPQPNVVASAVLGTALVASVLALAQVLWPVYGLLLFLLVPPMAGAVVLTRFGSMPYATQGRPIAPAPRTQPPAARAPIVPAPMPAAPVSPEVMPESKGGAAEAPVEPGVNPLDDAEPTSQEG